MPSSDCLPQSDVLVMAAAPADFRPAAAGDVEDQEGQRAGRRSRSRRRRTFWRRRSHARRAGAVIVGFALETNDVVANGRAKLASKDLDLIVVNDATEHGAGFGVDTNRVTLLSRDGAEERLPLMPKTEVADAILDRVERLIEWTLESKLRRYLEQRREMGETELVLDTHDRRRGACGSSARSRRRQPCASTAESSAGTSRARPRHARLARSASRHGRRAPSAPDATPRAQRAARGICERPVRPQESRCAADAAKTPPSSRRADVAPSGLTVGTPTVELFGGRWRRSIRSRQSRQHVASCTRCPLYSTAIESRAGRRKSRTRTSCASAKRRARRKTRPDVRSSARRVNCSQKFSRRSILTREDVFICNVLKHRPPGNRNPLPEEVTACSPYLIRQIELIKPKVILALGHVRGADFAGHEDCRSASCEDRFIGITVCRSSSRITPPRSSGIRPGSARPGKMSSSPVEYSIAPHLGA